MNKRLNLVEILKDCPKGMKLWSPCWGVLTYNGIDWREYDAWKDSEVDDLRVDVYPIVVKWVEEELSFAINGKYIDGGDVMLFPSKDNRDWSTFKAPKPKWNPETLQPFDKVLGIRAGGEIWRGDMFIYRDSTYIGLGGKEYDKMIPFNDETKHLLGTNQAPPEFYQL